MVKGLEKYGLFINFNRRTGKIEKQLLEAVHQIIQNDKMGNKMRSLGKSLIDGKGHLRVLDSMRLGV